MHSESNGKFDLKSYQFYIKHADKHKGILESIHNVIENGKAQWATKLRDKKYRFQFLDVGSGPGQLTIPVLQLLLNGREIANDSDEGAWKVGIVAYCMDPEREAMDALKKRLYLEGADGWIDIKFIREKIETWLRQKSSFASIPSFDFILCSHMLYYIEDWSHLINKFIRYLTPGSQLCIVLTSKETELYRLKERLIPELEIKPILHLRFAEDLETILKHKQIQYTMGVMKSLVTFSAEEIAAFSRSCLEKADPVIDILGFLFGYAPLDLKKKVFPIIRAFVNSRLHGNGLILPYKDKIFWITKDES